MSRSSTDDVEVVMCPASGSPGYYCNSDVCLNNVDSLHWLHLGFVVTMIVMSFLNYLPSQSTVFLCSSQWTGGCLCLHGLDFWKQQDWKTGGSFQGKNVSINFKISLYNFVVYKVKVLKNRCGCLPKIQFCRYFWYLTIHFSNFYV